MHLPVQQTSRDQSAEAARAQFFKYISLPYMSESQAQALTEENITKYLACMGRGHNPHHLATIDLRRWVGKPMVHPDMLLMHEIRVGKLARLLAQIIGLNPQACEHVEMLGTLHDRIEYFSPLGDIPTPTKIGFSPEHREFFDSIENTVTEEICQTLSIIPEKSPTEQLAIFREIDEKKTVASQLVKLADIIDAAWVMMLELKSQKSINHTDPEKANYFLTFYTSPTYQKIREFIAGDYLQGIPRERILYCFDGMWHADASDPKVWEQFLPHTFFEKWFQIHRDTQEAFAIQYWSEDHPGYRDDQMQPYF